MMKNKVFVIGVDGMDPRMTRKLVDEGKLPNIQKLIEQGSTRKDFVMLGGQPTITPPMWTTLATGAYPVTHGITCYWNSHPTESDRLIFTFDTAKVKAEQIWETAVKAGRKALVWTWPCSWPARIESENLHIVGGLAPSGPNSTTAIVEEEHITYASVNYKEITKRAQIELKGGAGCIATDDMRQNAASTNSYRDSFNDLSKETSPKTWLMFEHEEGEEACESEHAIDCFNVPIVSPVNWEQPVASDAKEFYVITAKGATRYPALLLKNVQGKYDHVAIYTSKKDAHPFVTLQDGEFCPLVQTAILSGGKKVQTTRHFTIIKIDPNGENVSISAGSALDIESERKESNWHPQWLYQQTVDIAGYVPATVPQGGGYPEMVSQRCLPSWNYFAQWQSKALLGLIEKNQYDAVFTHIHSCDHIGHVCWRWAKTREKYQHNDEKVYQSFLEEIYLQTDQYVATFLPLIEQGWDLILTSDHGLLCSEEDDLPYLGEAFVMNIGVLQELGYTVLKKDDNGNDIREIDWEKTTAVAPRGNHIYLNLKGRNPHGIVKPSEKYEVERKIIDDLYAYRLNGKRVVNIALRNKDAILLGLGGSESGDIIYFLEEGFNRLHGDALSTTEGYFHTSVSPIFIAAGPGIKKGYYTERIIREVDVAPTVSALMGIPISAQCEGAPIYQILESGEYCI